MFNSTHTLVGLALARTGLDRWAPHATWAAVIAANLPDIDILAQFAGTTTYLDYHRGITHTIVETPLLCLAFADVMFAVSRGKAFWKYFLIAIIAMSTHLLLDWTNTYGIRPFLPLNGQWYYGDTLFIIDPYLDGILLAGIIVTFKMRRQKQLIAAATLIVALAYIAGMIHLRDIARRQFAAYIASTPDIVRSAVAPEFGDPFHWIGFIETAADVSRFHIDTRTASVRAEDRLANAPPSQVTQAAESTYTAAVFRGFARFPVTRVERIPSGYRVLLIDFRFFRPPAQTALSAEILLDKNLAVTAESMSFVRPLD